MVFVMVWLAVLVAIITQNVFGPALMSKNLSAGLFLLLVWSLGLWGLNQKPGFDLNNAKYQIKQMLA